MNEEERLTQRPGSSNLLFKKKKLQKGGSMYLGKKSLSGKVIEKKNYEEDALPCRKFVQQPHMLQFDLNELHLK